MRRTAVESTMDSSWERPSMATACWRLSTRFRGEKAAEFTVRRIPAESPGSRARSSATTAPDTLGSRIFSITSWAMAGKVGSS